MPHPGTVWAPATWDPNAWAAGTWADAGTAIPIVPFDVVPDFVAGASIGEILQPIEALPEFIELVPVVPIVPLDAVPSFSPPQARREGSGIRQRRRRTLRR